MRATICILLVACGPGSAPGPEVYMTGDKAPFPWQTLPSGAREPAGFGINGTVWFQLDSAIDPLTMTSAVQYFRMTESGEREVDLPVTVEWTMDTFLVIRPVQPLLPNRLHGVVVSDRIKAVNGSAMATPELLQQLKDGKADDAALQSKFDLLWKAQRDKGPVRAATIWRSGDPLRETLTLGDVVEKKAPPVVSQLLLGMTDPQFCVVTGEVDLVNLQSDTGEILGTQSDRSESVRFALSVPRVEPPEQGYPVVLYAPGLGGSYLDFVERDVARAFALSQIAVMSIEAPHVGPRSVQGDTTGEDFTSRSQPVRARDNVRQLALDYVRLAAAPGSVVVPAGMCDSVAITLDQSRVFFWGHQVGANAGAIVLGLSTRILGGLLSGFTTEVFGDFNAERERGYVVAEPIDPLLWARRWNKPTLVIVERERIDSLPAAAPSVELMAITAPTGSTGAAVFKEPAAQTAYRCFFEALARGEAPDCNL